MPDKELVNAESECLKLKKAINDNHRLAQKAATDAVERGVLTGELLQRWKELLPHGGFEDFVEAHFEGSLRTAQQYMKAAKGLNTLSKAQRTALLDESKSIVGLISAKGKPGGDSSSSSATRPASSGPASDEAADSSSLGKCPNCAGAKWKRDDFGCYVCAKCKHPHGEPRGDADEDRVKTQAQKTVKTAEALMRAFDDLNHLLSKPDEHTEAIASCKFLLKTARAWK